MKPATLELEYTDESGMTHQLKAERTHMRDEWELERWHETEHGGWHYEGSERVTGLELEGSMSTGGQESTAVRGDF